MDSTSDQAMALQDIRVLDLSESIAGQYCCRLLADYGAAVTLVEPPAGSVTRRIGPFANGESTLFFHLNNGKRSMMLDPKTTAGAGLLHRLVTAIDVVVVDQDTDRSGFAAANAGCIVAVVSPFGQDLPWSEWQGTELVYQALSGVMINNGIMGRPPLYGCGHRASFAAGGRDLYRHPGRLAGTRGTGDRTGGRCQHRRDGRDDGDRCDRVRLQRHGGSTQCRRHQVRCRDGWIVVWIYNHLWQGFCDAIDAPALFADPRFAHPNDRQRNWAELMRILQAHVADRPAAEVVSRLQEKRLIAAKAAHLTELVRDHPHLSARGFFETVATEAGPRLVLGPPFRMARTPRVLRGDAPAPPAAEAEMHR